MKLLNPVLVWFIQSAFLVLSCCSDKNDKTVSSYTVEVHRRVQNDIYQLNQHSNNVKHDQCDSQTTYMVEKRQCSRNEDIFASNSISMHECNIL